MPVRRRWRESPAVLFASLAVIALLLVIWHYHAASHGRVSPPEQVVLTILEPPQRLISRCSRWVVAEWESVVGWRRMARENQSLKRQVAELEAQKRRLLRYLQENQRLRKMLDLEPGIAAQKIAAEVVAIETQHGARTVWVNRGSNDGIQGESETALQLTGDPVISESGLVGRVLRCDSRRSYILLITDDRASVGARCVRSDAIGIVKGTGGGCRLEYLDQKADIREGDALITSGLGGVFPKGLHVGSVTAVRKDVRRPTQIADVEPAARLDRLDEVFILRIKREEQLSR